MHRGEIDEAGVEPVDLRGERLDVERAEHRFEPVRERREADHGLRRPRLEGVFHHVEHEERAHPVIGEALPHLGREQIGQGRRMAEEIGRGGGLRRGGITEGCLAHAGKMIARSSHNCSPD